jgi:hypothetical protein
VVNRKSEPEDDDFLLVLEKGVRDVLAKKTSTAGERLAAVNAGAKLLAIRHKISAGDETGFFDR